MTNQTKLIKWLIYLILKGTYLYTPVNQPRPSVQTTWLILICLNLNICNIVVTETWACSLDKSILKKDEVASELNGCDIIIINITKWFNIFNAEEFKLEIMETVLRNLIGSCNTSVRDFDSAIYDVAKRGV